MSNLIAKEDEQKKCICVETDVVISDTSIVMANKLITESDEAVMAGGDVYIFADLRIDLENNQLDINYGATREVTDEKTKEVRCAESDSYWSMALDINYCPICGRKFEVEDE